jgi:hypothetical protein
MIVYKNNLNLSFSDIRFFISFYIKHKYNLECDYYTEYLKDMFTNK